MDSFDPYLHWLNIPSQLRPINHYILLGIRLFEDDPSAIDSACESRLEMLKEFQTGERGEISEQIMTEIAKAKIELLDSTCKTQYDRQLRQQWKDLEIRRENEVDSVSPSDSNQPEPKPSDARRSGSADRHEELPPSIVSNNSKDPLPVESAVKNSVGSSGDVQNDQRAESLVGMLLDIRILVALLSIVVVVMTATILVFSDRGQDKQLVEPENPPSLSGGASGEPASDPVQTDTTSNPSVSNKAIPIIQQASDGSFVLTPKLADVSRAEIELDSNKIANWQNNDQAEWRLATTNRRTGYFYCEVTYQAKSESLFSVQLGQISERAFTLYPRREDFTERFIVRLEKSDEQSLTLTAKQVESIAEVQIKRVKLVPK